MSKPKVVENTKHTVTESVKTTARIVKNLEQLTIGTALLVTTIFAYTQVDTITNQVWKYTVLASIVIVGLLAFTQLVRFLNREV